MSAIRKVAVIGAGAAGAATAAALHAEDYFDEIKVFERRESAGGTWLYDADPGDLPLTPGALPPEIDRPLDIPDRLPRTISPSKQHRFDRTPIYEELTTNVPDVAMSFTDVPFPYGPFVPHWIPKQYIQNYFAWHRADSLLQLRSTVEDLVRLNGDRWRLTLRSYDAPRHVDVWWEEDFDAVAIANGHYSVPFVPAVPGLEEFRRLYPGRIQHSKSYRSPRLYQDQRVLVIGNSASGFDVAHQLVQSGLLKGPLYVSRRSRGRWDGNEPPPGILWKPVINHYGTDGSIVFADGSVLKEIDSIIYCTGYQPSYPFWNHKKNGRPLYDYETAQLVRNYQHTFMQDFPTLAMIGFPRVLTFRSFEYQAIAVARLWSKRNSKPMPSLKLQRDWQDKRAQLIKDKRRKFHQIDWDDGETVEWFKWLFEFSGLPSIDGHGRFPPVLDSQTRWAIEHIKKYPTKETLLCRDPAEPAEVSNVEPDSLGFL